MKLLTLLLFVSLSVFSQEKNGYYATKSTQKGLWEARFNDTIITSQREDIVTARGDNYAKFSKQLEYEIHPPYKLRSLKWISLEPENYLLSATKIGETYYLLIPESIGNDFKVIIDGDKTLSNITLDTDIKVFLNEKPTFKIIKL